MSDPRYQRKNSRYRNVLSIFPLATMVDILDSDTLF